MTRRQSYKNTYSVYRANTMPALKNNTILLHSFRSTFFILYLKRLINLIDGLQP